MKNATILNLSLLAASEIDWIFMNTSIDKPLILIDFVWKITQQRFLHSLMSWLLKIQTVAVLYSGHVPTLMVVDVLFSCCRRRNCDGGFF